MPLASHTQGTPVHELIVPRGNMEKLLISLETRHQFLAQFHSQHSTNPTPFMSVQCTKEFKMLYNNENRRENI